MLKNDPNIVRKEGSILVIQFTDCPLLTRRMILCVKMGMRK